MFELTSMLFAGFWLGYLTGWKLRDARVKQLESKHANFLRDLDETLDKKLGVER